MLAADSPEILSKIISGASLVASIAALALVYRVRQLARRDTWVRTFAEIHQEFWNDDNVGRSWLAYDEAYEEIKLVLQVRLAQAIGHEDVAKYDRDLAERLMEKARENDQSPIKYMQEKLDDLDRTLSILCRATWAHEELLSLRTTEGLEDKPDIWRELIYDYWVHSCFRPNREHLVEYMALYWPRLFQQGKKDVERWGNRTVHQAKDVEKTIETVRVWLAAEAAKGT